MRKGLRTPELDPPCGPTSTLRLPDTSAHRGRNDGDTVENNLLQNAETPLVSSLTRKDRSLGRSWNHHVHVLVLHPLPPTDSCVWCLSRRRSQGTSISRMLFPFLTPVSLCYPTFSLLQIFFLFFGSPTLGDSHVARRPKGHDSFLPVVLGSKDPKTSESSLRWRVYPTHGIQSQTRSNLLVTLFIRPSFRRQEAPCSSETPCPSCKTFAPTTIPGNKKKGVWSYGYTYVSCPYPGPSERPSSRATPASFTLPAPHLAHRSSVLVAEPECHRYRRDRPRTRRDPSSTRTDRPFSATPAVPPSLKHPTYLRTAPEWTHSLKSLPSSPRVRVIRNM